MGKIGSPDVGFFLIGGYDLLGVSVTEFKFTHSVEIEEETASGDADEAHAIVGLARGELQLAGFYEDAAGKSDVALIAFGDRVVLIGHVGNAIGDLAYGFAGAVEATYDRKLTLAELHKAEATFKMNGPIERHRVLHEHSAETAASGDTESDSVDNAASSAAGGAGILEVENLTLGGYDDVTVKVRDSTDDVVWADLVTFTDVSAAKTAQRSAVTGTVDRYLSHSWLFNGAGTGQSIKYAVSFARG